MMEFNEIIVEKAKKVKSIEELLLLAKENEFELTKKQASLYFDKINPKLGQLSDEELNNVSGGMCTDDCNYDFQCLNCPNNNPQAFTKNTYYKDTEYKCLVCHSTCVRLTRKKK